MSLKHLLLITLGGLFLNHAQAAEPVTPIVIHFSHVVADDTPKGQGALLFKELVEKRLNGLVKVEVHGHSSLYGDEQELQALLDGKVQMLAPSLAKFDTYSQQLRIFDLPFLFDDLAAVDRFQKRAKGRQLLRSMEKHNILGLAYWHNGMKQLSATRALTAPADAAGLSFRIQPSDVLKAQFDQVGATTQKLPFSELYAALKDGRVQGAENTWSNIYSQNLYSVQPVITETHHGVLDYMLVTNPRFWFGLPHGVRTELEAIIDEVTFSVNHAAAARNAQDRKRVIDSGASQVVALSAEQRRAWRDSMRPVWQQFEDSIGAELLKAAETVNRKQQE
ncbi:MAG: TRAP transporter substrate-binding protein [Pseudomonas sp.]|uniref:TRAP transporter substrate-binding protein n=1 Tax=Pseudomonas sp. TaxID=306 RepID=UPI00339411C2